MENKTLQTVKVTDIAPNPHNPRLVFEEGALSELRKSIEKVGILVPLTVYENRKGTPPERYILLDGERRWRCAQELSMEEIPVNIIDEPEGVTQNILYMFNIHHFRKEWALFPTALKLEMIIRELGTDNERTLHEFTGVNRSTIRRCRILLWFPHKYRNYLMEKGAKISTDFFIELHPIAKRLSHESKFYFSEGTERLVDKMIDKFLDGHIVDVKDFREIRKSMAYYEKSNNFEEFIDKIEMFINNSDCELDIFMSTEVENDKVRQNILKYTSYLINNLKDINPDLISDYYFVNQIKALHDQVENILEEID
ncbi:ParB/RepB/Spo0J family partition protein [Methanolobus sediminis]|uniref:ParB/RepB/Spo0J family partition protein n=1 Tax=Methanolobus sediminis TaxID=3072978 RepID=A0AA51UJH4_9EURY|nr:ParB/RepB/Spo0J family partition protein [Methanolobus sediminis]WMW24682.1 ParB/RepB/Spo0J family partition protein [Methanolobus sediminis]